MGMVYGQASGWRFFLRVLRFSSLSNYCYYILKDAPKRAIQYLFTKIIVLLF